MSSHSTKTAGRSSKTARRPDKKSAKSARTEIKKGGEIGPPSGRQIRAARRRHGDPRAQHCAEVRAKVRAQAGGHDNPYAEPADAAGGGA